VPYRITRPTLLLWVPVAAALVLSWRTAYQRIFAHAIFAGNLLMIADRRLFERVWAEAAAGLPGLYRVLEVIEPERPDLAAHLAEVVYGSAKADIVVGFGEGASGKLLSSLVVAFCERGVRVRLLADLYEEMTGRLLIEQLDYAWVMSLPRRSEASEVYTAFKRGVDILAGAAALAALAILFPFLALAIKLGDRTPVVYRQTRVGRYGPGNGARSSRQKLARGPSRSQPAISKGMGTRTWSRSPRPARPWSSWVMARDLSRGRRCLRRHSPGPAAAPMSNSPTSMATAGTRWWRRSRTSPINTEIARPMAV